MTPHPTRVRRPSARRGFSFAEVMFAVVILGIGFIMVASVFPVALQQTQATAEENAAGSAAKGAAEAIAAASATLANSVGVTTDQPVTLSSTPGPGGTAVSNGAPIQRTVGAQPMFPPTVKNYVLGSTQPNPTTLLNLGRQTAVPPAAIVVPFTGPRWDFVRANTITPADPRFAYVAFYRRENNSNVAQLIIVAVASRQQTVFDSTALDSIGVKPVGIPRSFAFSVSADRLFTPTGAVYAGSPPTPPFSPPAVVNHPLLGPDRYDDPAPTAPLATQIIPDSMQLSQPALEGAYATVLPPVVASTLINYGSTKTAYQQPSPGRTYLLGRTTQNGAFILSELLPGGDLSLSPGVSNVNGVSNWGTVGRSADSATFPTDPLVPADPRGSSTSVQLSVRSNGQLQPVVAYVTLGTAAASQTGRMTLYANPDPRDTTTLCTAAAPGAFVILADDFPCDPNLSYGTQLNYALPPNYTAPGASWQIGALNGRIFRLGSAATQDLIAQPDGKVITVPLASGTFDLDAAYPMRPIPADPNAPQYSPDTVPNPTLTTIYPGNYDTVGKNQLRARAYVVGLPIDPVTKARSGTAQDIGCFSTFIPVR